jgi:uncharacterized protein with von Willebrand factor type A (vWA) domain
MTERSRTVSTGNESYTRDDAAKAVAFGFAEIAKADRRDFAWCIFAGRGADMPTGEAIGGRMSPDEQLRFLSTFLNGGTDYQQPLDWAMKKVGESRYGKADIVIITDGECSLYDETFLRQMDEFKKTSECRIWIVYVDEGNHNRHPWTDGQWTDLLDSSAKELYGSV